MLFFGYWGVWFLLGILLVATGKLKVTSHGRFSLLALTVWAAVLAVPASLAHCAFIR
jgi:hypothetical protein